MITFEPPTPEPLPYDPWPENLKDRFARTFQDLQVAVGLLLDEITAHPRHNQKLARVKQLLQGLESATEAARTLHDKLELETGQVERLVRAVEMAAIFSEQLAMESLAHPNSVLVHPPKWGEATG